MNGPNDVQNVYMSSMFVRPSFEIKWLSVKVELYQTKGGKNTIYSTSNDGSCEQNILINSVMNLSLMLKVWILTVDK